MKMRLVDGFVVDLSEDPEAQYHPLIAAEFIAVPADAPADLHVGYHYDGTTWTAPTAPEETPAVREPVYRTVMSAVRFKAQFTLAEQMAIQFARAYVPAKPDDQTDQKLQAKYGLDLLFKNLDDLIALKTDIDVMDPAVIGGLEFCRQIGVLTTDDRVAEIKRGILVGE